MPLLTCVSRSSTSTNTTSLTTAGPPGPGVEITCESCYIKGGFTASLKVKDNSTDALTKYTNDVHDSVQTVTQTAFNQITDGLQTSTPLNATSGDIETAPAQLPTVNVNFDLDLGPLPGVSAQFQFNEGLELYMLLNTKIAVGSTYIVNLFSSKTSLDVIIGSNITAGVALDIDLVLTSRDAVDLTSGFHLRLDKGASMEFDLFSSNVSNVAMYVFPPPSHPKTPTDTSQSRREIRIPPRHPRLPQRHPHRRPPHRPRHHL